MIDSLVCMRCGYALRGLDRRGRCPECGDSIAASAHADSIARLERRYGTPLGPRVSLQAAILSLVGAGGLAAAHAIALLAASRPAPNPWQTIRLPGSLWPVVAGTIGALVAARCGWITVLSSVDLALRSASVLALSLGAASVTSLLMPGEIGLALVFLAGLHWTLRVPDEDQRIVGAMMAVPAAIAFLLTGILSR